MRIVLLTAALLLVAGCSNSADEAGEQYKSLTPIPSKSATTSAVTPTSTTPTSPVPAAPPAAGAPIKAVTSWVEAGGKVEPDGFHTATRDGQTTDLGDDVAFVTPSGTSRCMTDSKYSEGALACLVRLSDPPERPAGAEGEWIGGWVDFTGNEVQIGSLHGDPGRFTAGDGPALDYGRTLRFADYQCRSDPTGLYCVDFANQTGIRLSDAGVEPFGCLRETEPAEAVGQQYSC